MKTIPDAESILDTRVMPVMYVTITPAGREYLQDRAAYPTQSVCPECGNFVFDPFSECLTCEATAQRLNRGGQDE